MSCSSIQRYGLDQFLACRKALSDAPIPDSLAEKLASYKTKYACFGASVSSFGGSGGGGGATNSKWNGGAAGGNSHIMKRYEKIEQQKQFRTEKIKIGCKELSRENLARKDFIALMNKLTVQNKAQIMTSIKHVFREDCSEIYTSIMWDMLQRAPDFLDMYMEVICMIAELITQPEKWKSQWESIWKRFADEREWVVPVVPAAEAQQEDDYDEFCESVKRKKRVIAAIKSIIRLRQKGWVQQSIMQTLGTQVLEACNAEMEASSGSKVADAYLDQLICLVTDGADSDSSLNDKLYTWITGWEARKASLKPSTRFKLLDLRDALTQKMKPVYNKWRRGQKSNQNPPPTTRNGS